MLSDLPYTSAASDQWGSNSAGARTGVSRLTALEPRRGAPSIPDFDPVASLGHSESDRAFTCRPSAYVCGNTPVESQHLDLVGWGQSWSLGQTFHLADLPKVWGRQNSVDVGNSISARWEWAI